MPKEPSTLATVPLITGYWETKRPIHGWRPRGRGDWLLIMTESGQGRIGINGKERLLKVGDIVLFRPGTPQDYGKKETLGTWKHVWTHFVPPPDWLQWMHWPELSKGLMHLRLNSPLKEEVLRELAAMDRAVHSAQSRKQELGLNSLERALLLCDGANPLKEASRRDLRIQSAADYLCGHIDEAFSLAALARKFGLSRSRFAWLFKHQLGESPSRYLELQRVYRARQLLEYTTQTLGEIAEQIGFSSPFYLSLRFKHHFGQSPRAFRRVFDSQMKTLTQSKTSSRT